MSQSYSTSHNWRRLVRFIAKEDDKIYAGEPLNENIDVGLNENIEVNVFKNQSALKPIEKTGELKTIKKLLSPIDSNEVQTVRLLGLNYRDHAEECGLEIPKQPVLFYKPITSLNSPNDDIPIPNVCKNMVVDYEAEFVAVISKPAKNVSVDDALNYVLGYSLGNDISVRKLQFITSQWGFSKSFDGSAPWGPVLINAKNVDPQLVPLKCDINGVRLQDSNTSKQIFSLAQTISFLSQGTTLLPGSLIWTGTPAGVGFTQKPRITLNGGDQVKISSNSTFGTLVNKIREENNN